MPGTGFSEFATLFGSSGELATHHEALARLRLMAAPEASSPYRGGAATKKTCETAFLTAQWERYLRPHHYSGGTRCTLFLPNLLALSVASCAAWTAFSYVAPYAASRIPKG